MHYSPRTKKYLDAIKQTPPHALLLTGEKGAGLFTAAKHIAGDSLAEVIKPRPQNDRATTAIIGVEQVNALYTMTKGKSTHRQYFIIDDADDMSEVAQNKFLKLLEEPAPQVHFILTAHQPDKLLQTIRSRLQILPIHPITSKQTDDMLQSVKDPRKMMQIRFLSTGKPAEITRLLTDEAYFNAQSQLIRDAQVLVSGERYQRILQAFKYAGNRDKALALLLAAKTVLSHTINTKPAKETIDLASRLSDTIERIGQNGNVRLQLLYFVL